jgi:hypothetical protein
MCFFICPISGCKNDDYETMLSHIEEKPGDLVEINKNAKLVVGKNYAGRIVLGWLGSQVAYTWAHSIEQPYVAWCEPKTILSWVRKNYGY